MSSETEPEVKAGKHAGAVGCGFVAGSTLVGFWLGGTGVGFVDLFLRDTRWVNTLVVVWFAVIAGSLFDKVQPTWEDDGEWSPRVVGYTVGGGFTAAGAIMLFWLWFYIG